MDGEGIMLSEKSQIETNTIVSPICGFLKNENTNENSMRGIVIGKITVPSF